MSEFESPDEELVAATPSQRNWKGILIALLVICAVCGLIMLSIVLLRPPDNGPRVKGRKITLADIVTKQFVTQPFDGSWISDHELMFRDYLGGLSILNVDTLSTRPFVANITFRQLNSQIYSVSPDRKFILFVHDQRPVWKYSYLAKYTIYDIENEFRELSPFDDAARELGQTEQPELQYATWCHEGNSLFFVYQNDIYYKPHPKNGKTIRVTKTGEPGLVFNGIPDWVYEEEILQSKSALWPSRNGQKLLYLSFNDSGVGETVYPWFGENVPYPKLRRLRYPKAGTTNPKVSLFVTTLDKRGIESTVLINPSPPISGRHYNENSPYNGEFYITGASWVSDTSIVVITMSRRHNAAVVSLCHEHRSDWNCEEIYSIKNQDSGWLDYLDLPIFSRDASSCLLRVPWRDGAAGLYQHVLFLDIKARKEIPITHGPFEVTKILAWDQPNQLIYFTAAPKGGPGQRHLYRVAEKSTNSTTVIPPECLTCVKLDYQPNKGNLSKPKEADADPDAAVLNAPTSSPEVLNPTTPATDLAYKLVQEDSGPNGSATEIRIPPCLYTDVNFSPNKRHFVMQCWGPGVPQTTLHSAPLGRLVHVLNNNTALKDKVAGVGMPQILQFKVEVSGGYHAPVRLFLPAGLRDDEEFKFPLLLQVGGGPGTQLISEKWDFSWISYLTSEKNFIVAQIDGRGTGFQGESNRHSIYKRLGTTEVSDQIEALIYLKNKLGFIDHENMAVWGKGYGGYSAILALSADAAKLFRCAIAVTPITKWEFHNSAYTEKYMSLPNVTDNYWGYEQAGLTRPEVLDNLRNKSLLLIHGTADKNVHFQHTLHFSKHLIKHGITFKSQIYPDEDHQLDGVQEHYYQTMESFINSSFDPTDFEDWDKANFLGIKMA